jgi:hypothetical protein
VRQAGDHLVGDEQRPELVGADRTGRNSRDHVAGGALHQLDDRGNRARARVDLLWPIRPGDAQLG